MKSKYLKSSKQLNLGLGLRPQHYENVLSGQASVDWFEVISENFLGIEGGCAERPLKILKDIRKNHSIVLHGVGMSIASKNGLDKKYLKKLKNLIEIIEPTWVSDHFCWTGFGKHVVHDLLPVPYTQEVIEHLVLRIHRVQDYLKRQMVFENVSSYISFKHSEMTEWEFISEVCRRSGCKLLLDINNIYVSSVNHTFKPQDYIDGIKSDLVQQIHLAGHQTKTKDQHRFLIDTHDHAVSSDVWGLYAYAIKKFGRVPTMIEWDAKIPSFEILQTEAFKAEKIMQKICQRRDFENDNKSKISRRSEMATLDHC